MSRFVIEIEEEDGEFFVTSPDMPELLTSGRSLSEALVNAADAVHVVLAGRAQDEVEGKR